MNFAGKFDAKLPADVPGSLSHAHVHVETLSASAGHAPSDAIIVPDVQLLFNGDFKRSGLDLILSKDDHELVLQDYFKGEKRAALSSPDGAHLTGDIVNALTGHVQYAQADGSASAGKVIGHVTKLVGTATAIRNGVSIILNNGDNVEKGDVVQAGSDSMLGITFIDGTVFALSSNARMVLNDMVYDANGSNNSSLLSLVAGTISFVAGETAKHGDMKVTTPVATMGIRGTAVLVEIGFEIPVTDPNTGTQSSIPVKFQVLQEPNGTVGSYVLYAKNDLTYSNPIATISRAGEVTSYSANGNLSVAQVTQLAPEAKAIIDAALGQYFPNYTPSANPQGTTPNGSTPPNPVVPPPSPPEKVPLNPTGTPTPAPINYNAPNPANPDVPIVKTVDVIITPLNTPPTFNVTPVVNVITPVVADPIIRIPDQVTGTDPDPNDVVVKYVPGSGRIVSAVGPAYAPAGVDLKSLVLLNQATGDVTYNSPSFAFLKADDQVVVTVSFDVSSGPDTIHQFLTVTIVGVNDAPTITAATLTVSQGGTVLVTASNIGVIDPDNTDLTFAVSNVSSGDKFQVLDGSTWVDATTFTTADLAAGHARFVQGGSFTAPTFSIQANDGSVLHNLSNVFTGVVNFVPVAGAILGDDSNNILVGTPGNDVFEGFGGNDQLQGGGGRDKALYADATAGITVHLAAGTVHGTAADDLASIGTDTLQSIEYIVGSNFDDTFDATGFSNTSNNAGSVPTAGRFSGSITNFFEGLGGDDHIIGNGATQIAYDHASAGVTVDLAAGTGHGTALGDVAGVGNDDFSGVTGVRGSAFADRLSGNDDQKGVDVFYGGAGDDCIDGRAGYDLVVYKPLVDNTVTGGITVDMAAGTVLGDSSVGNDTLRSIEAIRGTDFNDNYNAAGFGSSGANVGSLGAFNQFEGMGGNDVITGNNLTTVEYTNTLAGVTVDIAAGNAHSTAAGDAAGIGVDTFSGVNGVRGSEYEDFLYGSNNPLGTAENFTGGGGDDTIDGRGGFDRAIYSSTIADRGAGGITVNLALGTVVGIDALGIAAVGSDILKSIEGVRGTNFNDIYNAAGFGGASTNAGSFGTFNEFEGMDGDDFISGNGNTKVAFYNALAGVTVNLATGSARDSADYAAGTTLDLAGIGKDTITLGTVNAVAGSAFADSITGDDAANILTGGGGNDAIDGGAGTDLAVFSGAMANYSISFSAGQIQVTDAAAGRDGTDTLSNVEALQFTDGTVLVASGTSVSPIDLAALTQGIPLNSVTTRTGGANDFVRVNSAMNGLLIDLGAGTGDTVLLGSPGSYSLNLADVEKVGGTSGDDTVTLQKNADGLAVDLGAGNNTIYLAGGSNTLSAVNVQNINGTDFSGAAPSNDTLTLLNNVSGVSINLAQGANTLNLAAGSNTLANAFGVQTIKGTASGDSLTLANAFNMPTLANTFNITVDLAEGVDTLTVTSGAGLFPTLKLVGVEYLAGTSDDNYITLMDKVDGLNVDLGQGNDTLMLANGINSVSVTNVETISASDFPGGPASSDTLTLLNNVTGVSVDLKGGTNTLNLHAGINSLAGVFNVQSIHGSASSDTLTLGEANGTTIDLGAGNDTLNLGPATSGVTFVYADNGGADVVSGFNQGDKIDLTGIAGVHSLADLNVTQYGADTVINFGNGNSLTLTGVTATGLVAQDFVFAPNHAPTLANVDKTINDTAYADTFGTVTGALIGHDSDVGQTLSYAAIDGTGDAVNTGIAGVYGTLTVNSNGSYNYVPNATAINAAPAGAFSDTFSIVTSDGMATTEATLTVHVNGVNDTPVANDDTLALSTPAGGGWSFNSANGHFYRLVASNVSWTEANDDAQSDGAYLATITSQAEQDFVHALTDGVGGWLGGYSSDASQVATWQWVTGPETGAHFVYQNWNFGEPSGWEYDPPEGLHLQGSGGWNDVPTTPDWHGGYVEEWGGRPSDANVGEDSTLTIATSTLLANDADADSSDHPTIVSVSATSADGALVTVSGTTISYDPTHAVALQALKAGETTTDTFTYTIDDGHGGTDTATVTLVVAGINDAPDFTGEDRASIYVASGAEVALVDDVSASDIDSINYAGGSLTATVTDGFHVGDALSIANDGVISVASGGIVMFDADGYGGEAAVLIGTRSVGGTSLTVTLNANADDAAIKALTEAIRFETWDSTEVDRTVTFTLNDGDGIANGGDASTSFDATVHFVPTSPNQAPLAVDDTNSGHEDTTVTGTVASNDSDVDDGETATLIYMQTSAVAGLTINEDGSYSFDAGDAAYQHLAAGVTMDVVASYTVTDVHGAYSTGSLTITLTGTNDAPVAVDGSNSGYEDTTITGTVASDDSDVDDGETATLTYAQTGAVAGLTINSDGSYSFDAGDAAYQYLAAGATMDVVASYTVTDIHGADSTGSLTITLTGVNDPPTGSVTISGTAQENQVLTASNMLADADGLGAISYQWQRDGIDIGGATGTTYTLGNADVGHTIDVVAHYTDGHGTLESVASAATAAVTNVNDAPTGSVTISGTVQQNQVLTASNTLADADGLGAISYQWQRDGVDIGGATGTTYTLGNADVGHTIDVVAHYTDGHGTLESVTSAATAAVTNVNDAPTGSVTISGTVQENQVLTASNTLADADGLGAISYQWQHDGIDIGGATGTTYTLGNADVGHTIDVVAHYTDGHGTLESVASAATAAVTNVNDAPTGSVTISGTVQENQVLTASNTLADADGLGAISYQWQRDGVDIGGATGTTYTLGNADVGHTIDVVAKYADGHGTAESVASAATVAVTNVNDPPTGTVTISGTAQENQVLTASNTLADANGLGAISYQWQREGVDIGGATGTTYTLGSADVGHAIDVVAHYTDDHGTAESVASAQTTQVAGVGVIIGDNNSNTLTGTAGNDTLQGFGGNDSIIGLTGIDRAVYTDATGGITADLAAGTVSGSGVGTDTLTGIEAIQGSNFIDHYSAAGFTGDAEVPGVPVDFNSFEGMGGDDLIIGSVNVQGQVLTRVVYSSATGAVTVDFADATTVGTDHFTGTAIGDVSVGTDHFTNVNTVVGSGFGDTLRGSNNANGTYEQYDGRAGNDLIDGRGGYDFAVYNNDPATVSGITVNLAAGIVTGDASVGIDTLRNVEAVRGTNFADTYNAVGFSGSSTNAGSLGTFNNFDGVGGDDIILGNGNTRIQYTNALDAVTVDIVLGKAHGTAAGDAAGTGTDTFSGVNAVIGSMFGDTISGSGNNETFMGLAGDDTIDGRGGFDTVQYNNMTYTTGGISVDLAIGRVIGDASTGTDTLRSIESIQGTNFNDVYNAVGFGDSSHLDPTLNNVGNNGTYNQFEGLDGDDQITGNGNTRAVYLSAAAGVTVDLVLGTGKGTAAGDLANVGTDTFIGGVNGAVGSNFADMLLGSANASGTVEQFDGRGGNDTLDGRGGFDQATYANDANVTTGITVDMFSGTADGDAAVGHDTLISIESVIGTRFNDVYNAANFTGGSFGTFNEFQGYGGDDQITGNGNTQLGYNNATSGVTIDMTTGNAAGDASVGHDTFTGVSSVIGSNFDDTISGSNASEIFNGGSGNDTIRGRGGNDAMTGGAGADTFVYATGDGADQITDFLHVQGDRIDVTGVGGVLGLSDIVSHAAQQGSDTVITFSPGNSISLQNVTLGSLVASDFIFAAAGSTPTANDNNNSLVGTGGADTLSGLAGNDRLQGLADNDLLDGGLGFDRAVYTDATGGIIVDLAHGKSFGAGVGSDTLVSIEGAVGSEFADILDASGFTGSSGVPGTPIGFNEFEGRGGNDTITGLVNSQGATLTRVSYVNATAGVTVDFDAHYADGNASVGHDTFIGAGVANVFGSSSVDTLLGSDNPNGTVETFDGRAGNDTINGRGGFDRADYNNDPAVTTGIKVELAIGKVSPINPPDLTIGTDTLLSVEAVRGTSWDDTYDATGFGSGSANVGSNGTFNEFTGVGGNDTIIGNGNTRLSFNGATAGVTVDFQTGPTPGTGTAAGDASVGTDSFSGVNAVQASMFDDTLSGSSNNDTFTGLAGDDHIDGRGGFDTASYNNIYFTTGGINVDMASGDVTGDASIGHDTLRSIEAIQGTNFGDTFVATGYGLAGALNIGNNDTFNQFEGLAGNDTITGNGNTRLIFTNATAGVTINLATGDANGDASVGHDTFIGVNSVTGSNAVDTYVATGFGSFNAFQGMGGDDIITGSGNTQIFFTNATAGVTADLATGNAGGDASVGHDTFTGVNSVLGSNFSDTISGSNANEIFNGGSGGDILTGGAGSDNFVFRFSSGNDTVTDFTHNQDTIDIHDYATFTQNDSASFAAWIASAAVEEQGANTLIHLDTNNSVLLSNVAKASLAMNDFILHPAGQ